MKKFSGFLWLLLVVGVISNSYLLYGVNKDAGPTATNYYYLGNSTGLTNLGETLKILFNTQDITIGYRLMTTNNWEPHLSELMLKFVKPGDNVIDLGANYGSHTLRMAQKMQNQGKIFAFEANPKVFKLLKRSSDLNGFYNLIQPFNLLVTDKNDEKYIFTYSEEFNVGGSKISPTTDAAYIHNLDKFMELSSTKLDSIIPAGTKINFMKMDIEGSEFLALAGASRMLEESLDDIVILMEWNYLLINNPMENIKSLVSKYGFNVWFIQGRKAAIKVENFEDLNNQMGDLILSKKELNF